MEEEKKISHFHPVACPQCGGGGCDFCHYFGLFYWHGEMNSEGPKEYILFWGQVIDWPHIVQRHLKNIFNKVITWLVLIFGLAGLLSGAWILVEVLMGGRFFALNFFPFSFDFYGWPKIKADWRGFLFWLSLLTDCYLYYRWQRRQERAETVIKKVFHPKGETENLGEIKSVPTWEGIDNSRAERIDISLSYTPETIKVIEHAWRVAKNCRHSEVLPLHLLAGSFTNKKIGIIFSRLGTDWEKLTATLKKALAKISQGQGSPVLSLAVKNILFQAYEQAYLMRQSKVNITEILIALGADKSLASEVLYELEVEPNDVKNVIVWLQVNEKLRAQWKKYHRLGRRRPKGEVNKAYTAVMTPYLDNFSVDLTAQAAHGFFPPNIGRDKEIEEIFRIIQGSGGSVVLIGLPGVGKTAIIEEIAQRMIADEVPAVMQDKRLVSLSISRLTAGATPSEANQRLLKIFNEIIKAGNVILIIENVHDLSGISTGGEESLDLSEALTNYLAKTNSIAITTTTPKDYNFLEAGSSLGNYLHKVNIAEPQGDQAIQIAESRVGSIEYKNKVVFSYAAIAGAVKLSGQYIHDRYLPAKAIDILKEVAVAVAKSRGPGAVVLAEDVAIIISEKTNIPLTKIGEEESEKLVALEEEIHKRMVGQVEPVKEIASALRRARAGMRDQKRPIANFLFLGPTGVGKTELAKTIAEVYFGDEEKMIRLDMSEYQTKESLYRLIGAPTGRPAGGYLTEAVRKNPFSLILFDEIEKAHPDILNLFLQVMDDGRLTDNVGRTVDFTNAIIIMTSNAGTRYIQAQINAGTDLEQIKEEMINNQLAKFFRPEFLNRFDAINIFKPLSIDEVIQIAHLMIGRRVKSLLVEGVVLEVTPAAIKELAQLGFDPKFGARSLRRVIQERVNNTLANMKIKREFKRGDKVIFDVGGKVTVES